MAAEVAEPATADGQWAAGCIPHRLPLDSASPDDWRELDTDHLEVPLSVVAARLSGWVYHFTPLVEEYASTWLIRYEVLSSVEAGDGVEDIQRAIVAVTLTSQREGRAAAPLLDGAVSAEQDTPLRGRGLRILAVVFRGTASLQDWLQNAACVDDRVHFRSFGLGVHSGIWTYVANDFLRHGPALLEQVSCEAERGASLLLLTGHSLGGGLASILQLLLRLALDHPGELPCHEQIARDLTPGARALLESARTITFAAPMTVAPAQPTPQIEAYLQKRATNFVHNNDPIPRFPGELQFIEGVVRGAGTLRLPLADGMAIEIRSSVTELAQQVPALARYRHMGTIFLVQGNGEALRAAGDGGGALLREWRDPTVGGGIRNWWSDNAYDAGLDHNMERYENGLPWHAQLRCWRDLVRAATTSADLSGRDLGNGGAISIVEFLDEKVDLTHLCLAKNVIGDVGAAAIAAHVHKNQSLRKLDLSQNSVGDVGASALAASCPNHKCLGDFNLSENRVGDVGASALANALKENQSLGKLDLSANQVQDAGATGLAKALMENSELDTLRLSSNQVGDAGANAFASCLTGNRRLRTLILGRNQIGDRGAQDLARALKDTRSLRTLDLSRNRVGDLGETALAEALKGWGLINVDLSGNYTDTTVSI